MSFLDYTLGSELQLLDQLSISIAGETTIPDLTQANIYSDERISTQYWYYI